LARTRGDQFDATFLALARIGAREDIELFRARASDRNEILRLAAFEGMARAGDKDSLELFTRALEADRSDAVRTAAAFGLTLFGRSQTHVIASHVTLPAVSDQARDYLLEIGSASIPALQATLKVVKDGRDRAALIQLMGYVGASEVASAIEPFAGDKDERVRRAAAAALQRLRR
jgi:HEAT repeat protein